MLKIEYYLYSLIPRFRLNRVTGETPREGALLRVTWPDGRVGYGDCFPWPEFGDLPIQKQIEDLRKGRLSKILEQTIWLAQKDAELRRDKYSGLKDVRKIKNHFSVTDYRLLTDMALDEIKNKRFTSIKVKLGQDPLVEAEFIVKTLKKNPYLSFRVDFNGNDDFAAFEKFAEAIPQNLREYIEFVEDPVPYDVDLWVRAGKYFPLAIDFEIDKVDFSQRNHPFQVIILKPARQDVSKILNFANECDLKLVVTSSMDHPVGIVHALRVASEIRQKFPGRLADCGCLTQHLYWPDDFTKELAMQGPSLVQVKGYGIGFDKLLSALPWIPVSP
ncbi:MAG: hypothetical protein WCH11_04530 [Bdellovibrio sp.]